MKLVWNWAAIPLQGAKLCKCWNLKLSHNSLWLSFALCETGLVQQPIRTQIDWQVKLLIRYQFNWSISAQQHIWSPVWAESQTFVSCTLQNETGLFFLELPVNQQQTLTFLGCVLAKKNWLKMTILYQLPGCFLTLQSMSGTVTHAALCVISHFYRFNISHVSSSLDCRTECLHESTVLSLRRDKYMYI